MLISSGRQLSILAVDDEAGIRTSLAMVLKLAGHRPVIAADAEEALSLIASSPAPFDLVITDHSMPGLSGLELARRLRAAGYGGEIIVLTAYAGREAELEYKRLGVAGIMAKPYSIADLRQWMDCIQGCREQIAAGFQPACRRSGTMDFCWLKNYGVRRSSPPSRSAKAFL